MIIVDENNAIAGGAPEVILTELTLAIRLTREHLRDKLPCFCERSHSYGNDDGRGLREGS